MKTLLRTLLFLILIFNFFCTTTQAKNSTMEPLVDVHWLNKHLQNPELIILDASVIVSVDETGKFNMTSGKNQYHESHIPNASFADLLDDLSTTDSEMHFVMPTPLQFQKAINNLGISNDSQVVIYSHQPAQGWAQRVWWMLYWAGHDNIAILDGGFDAWTEAGFPVSNKPVNRKKSDYQLHLRNQVIANSEDVKNAIKDNNITIIDALPEGNYNGDFSMYERPGHIPSAINIPSQVLVADTGHYRPFDEIKTVFNSNPEKRVITYCGGGISASSTAFALHRLGYKDVAVYMGSLQEWAANKNNPMSVEH